MRDPRELLETVREIVSDPEAYPEGGYLLDMISTAVRMVRDRPDRGDLRMLRQAFKELRYAFKVFAPYRRTRKVSVFGSARASSSSPEYRAAHAFATTMTRLGWMVITGAGPGIMEAAQGGAGRARSFGVNIRLPFEQKANAVIHDDPKLVSFNYFFTRKVIFVKETDAIALFPGGFGTHDEAFESITLLQTGKSQLLPIVCVDASGGTYWKEWRGFIERQLLGGGYIDEEDLGLVHMADSIEDAAAIVRRFYSNYHSSRFVQGRFVVRLGKPVTDELLEELNTSYADILSDGRFARVECHAEEERDEPETVSLHRLGFWFNRRSVARLLQLVWALNEVESSAATGAA